MMMAISCTLLLSRPISAPFRATFSVLSHSLLFQSRWCLTHFVLFRLVPTFLSIILVVGSAPCLFLFRLKHLLPSSPPCDTWSPIFLLPVGVFFQSVLSCSLLSFVPRIGAYFLFSWLSPAPPVFQLSSRTFSSSSACFFRSGPLSVYARGLITLTGVCFAPLLYPFDPRCVGILAIWLFHFSLFICS